MKMSTASSLMIAFGVAAACPAWAQLSPGGQGGAVSDQQRVTNVDSNTQNQANTVANFTLPGIGAVIQQTLFGQARTGQRADLTLGPSHRGLAAGDGDWGWQVWTQGSVGGANSNAINAYNLTNYGAQVGIQAQVSPKLVLGVSGSWNGADGSLSAGFASLNSTFGVNVYAGWQFNENWNASAVAGFGSGANHLTNTGIAYRANYQTTTWAFQGGLNGYYKVGDVVLAPLVSLLYSPIYNYGYIDSTGTAVLGRNTALTRGSAGGFFIMPLTGWQPYIRATIEHDFAMPTGSEVNGSTGGTLGIGATVPFSDAIWGSLDASYNSIGRIGLSLWSASARVNLRF